MLNLHGTQVHIFLFVGEREPTKGKTNNSNKNEKNSNNGRSFHIEHLSKRICLLIIKPYGIALRCSRQNTCVAKFFPSFDQNSPPASCQLKSVVKRKTQ
jgi:hypothetical protein